MSSFLRQIPGREALDSLRIAAGGLRLRDTLSDALQEADRLRREQLEEWARQTSATLTAAQEAASQEAARASSWASQQQERLTSGLGEMGAGLGGLSQTAQDITSGVGAQLGDVMGGLGRGWRVATQGPEAAASLAAPTTPEAVGDTNQQAYREQDAQREAPVQDGILSSTQDNLPDFATLSRITEGPSAAELGQRGLARATREGVERVTAPESTVPGPLQRFAQSAGTRAAEFMERNAGEQNLLASALDLSGAATQIPIAGALAATGIPFFSEDRPHGPGIERETPILGGLTNPVELASATLGPTELAGGFQKLGRAALGAAGRGTAGEAISGITSAASRVAASPRRMEPIQGEGHIDPSALAAAITRGQDAIRSWTSATRGPHRDYVADLMSEVKPDGTPNPVAAAWRMAVERGQVNKDLLNSAIQAYKEEGLSFAGAIRAVVPGAEATEYTGREPGRKVLRSLQEATGERYTGLTGPMLRRAVADGELAGVPIRHTKQEGGAILAERNVGDYTYQDKRGQVWRTSSPYEILFMRQLDDNPDVLTWQKSGAELRVPFTTRFGTEAMFAPDFLVVGRDGRMAVVEIKNIGSFRQPAWRVPEKLREAREFFGAKGMSFHIFVEDQLGRGYVQNLTPEALMSGGRGQPGVLDPDQARELVSSLQRGFRSAWEMRPIGPLSGKMAITQEEAERLVREGEATAEEVAAMRGYKATGGQGEPFGGQGFADVLPPEQGGYRPEWTPHEAFAYHNLRATRDQGDPIVKDALAAFPQVKSHADDLAALLKRRKAQGGATFSLTRGDQSDQPKFYVSVLPDMELTIPGKPEKIHAFKIATFMSEAHDYLSAFSDVNVGVWYDAEARQTFFDLSVAVDDLDTAMALGRRMSQDSIYDARPGIPAEQRTIRIDYSDLGLPEGERPVPPPIEEQYDALRTFGGTRAAPQRPGAGRLRAGAAEPALPGGAVPPGAAAPGLPGGRQPGGLPAPGGGPGLAGLPPGSVGGEPLGGPTGAALVGGPGAPGASPAGAPTGAPAPGGASAALARRPANYPLPVGIVPGAGFAEEAASGVVSRSGRFYHGTPTPFPRPDPAAFKDEGLYGPAYYLTSDPRIAASYAEGGMLSPYGNARRDVEHGQEVLKRTDLTPNQRAAYERRLKVDQDRLDQYLPDIAGANIRPADLPKGLRFLDAEAPVPAVEMRRIEKAVGDYYGPAKLRELRDQIELETEYAGATGDTVYRMLAGVVGGNRNASHFLDVAGYDGVRYLGGQRTPLKDAAGRPIEHEAVALFPRALPKIRNALSGQPGGITAGAGSALEAAARPAALGTRAAQTSGERAFDIGTGLTSGTIAAATTEGEEGEAPTAQQRAARFVAGTLLGAPGGAALRQLRGRLPGGNVAQDARLLGAAAGAARGPKKPPQPRSGWQQFTDTAGSVARLSLVSGPLTVLRNIVGTAPSVAVQPALRFVQGWMDPIWLAYRPPDPTTVEGRRLAKEGRRYAGESGAMLRGYAHTFMAAAQNGIDVLLHGDDALLNTQLNRKGTTPPDQNVIEKGAAVGYRLLTAPDAFFTTLAEGGELFAQAYRMAKRRGLSGPAVTAEMVRLAGKPTKTMQKRANEFALRATFREELDKIGSGVQWLANAPVVGPLLLPFVKTPYNVVKTDIAHSPLFAGASLAYGMRPTSMGGADYRQLSDRAARLLVSGGVTAVFAKYAYDGNVTAGPPGTAAERQAWEQEGKQAFSIRIGDSWYDYRLFPGLNATLVQLATIAEEFRQNDNRMSQGLAARAGRVSMDVANALVQKPLLQNFGDLLEAVRDPERGGQRLTEKLGETAVGMAVPFSGLRRYVAETMDPYQRAPEGLVENLQETVPGLRENLPIRRTAFGREITKDAGPIEQAAMPIRNVQARPQEAVRRYFGSQSAEEDAAITSAIQKYERWQNNRAQYPKPTEQEMRLAVRFRNRENNRYETRRALELKRSRTERTKIERGKAGGGGGPINALVASQRGQRGWDAWSGGAYQ